jgi:hypothetical protein
MGMTMGSAVNEYNTPTNVAPQAHYAYRAGLERHIVPAGNNDRIVTKPTSDLFFGPSGLGFKGGFFTRVISWLARNEIQEQTGSCLDETSIEGCVKGWGQGSYSSRGEVQARIPL